MSGFTDSIIDFYNNFEDVDRSIEENILHNYTITNYYLVQLQDNERIVFFILFLLAFSLSMVGNIATLFTTYQRKIRLIQKTLIISLALSDITVCIFIGLQNMISVSHSMNNWILGDFMCSFVPYMQMLGSISNSITMVSIAFDRYMTILKPSNKQWNPNIWLCIVVLLAIWGFSAGVAYPIFSIMFLVPIKVSIRDPTNNSLLSNEILNLYLCTFSDRQKHKIMYVSLYCVMFLPLLLAFFWFYFKIAYLIWKRRKPINVVSSISKSVTMETSTNSKVSSMQSSVVVQGPSKAKSTIRTSRLHVERKIRTFKIILIIMIVFFVCRLPHWTYTMLKSTMSLIHANKWITGHALSLLVIFNTTLNPFLYSFLNQTIMYFDKFFRSVGDFISKICCCCCTNTEFDDFEKDNPFCPKNFEPKLSQTSSIVPKGPYDCNNYKPNNVRCLNIATLNLYPKDNNYQNCNTY